MKFSWLINIELNFIIILADDDELSKYEDNNHTSKAVNGLSNDFTQTQPPDIIFTEVTRENKEEKDGKERIDGVDSVDDSVNSGYKLGPNIQLKSRNKVSHSFKYSPMLTF